MSALIPALKNEHTKRILRITRIRPSAARPGTTAHYRMPVPDARGYDPPDSARPHPLSRMLPSHTFAPASTV